MNPTFLIVDLFCGAGGTTTGFEMTGGIAKVIACVNHDPKAIISHWKNHKSVVHFEEDIRTLKLQPLVDLVNIYRTIYPDAYVVLWASLECTNFSKAKGGLPRDADSRTLADGLIRYIDGLNPDYVQIENVVEFMSWGPLDENGKPISRKNGIDFRRWCSEVCKFGYRDEWREMNAADYGAYTSRNRLFGCFAKEGLPISWPQPTHSKKATGSLFEQYQKWKAVKDVLDLEDEGSSIFDRAKPLVDRTLERIYAGLVKFVAGGKNAFLLKYNSMNRAGKYVAPGIEGPAPVVSTHGRIGIVKTAFLHGYYGNGTTNSTDHPCPTITTKDRQAIVSTQFLDKQYGSGPHNTQGLEQPAGTITTINHHALVSAWVMDTAYSNVGTPLDHPAGVITANRKWHYLMNPQFFSGGSSVNNPCFTLIAKMDKRPPYLIVTEEGSVAIEVYETDSEVMKRIKQFMAVYGIVDIKMRMLKVPELLRIQGFPEGYHLEGSQADQKKFIGNSVVPIIPKVWAEAMHNSIETQMQKIA